MYFPPQKEEGYCGLYSVRYANILLKKQDIKVPTLIKLLDKSKNKIKHFGINEYEIAKLGSLLGYDTYVKAYTKTNSNKVLQQIRKVIAEGGVVITSWHGTFIPHFHWVCVGGITPRKVMVADSEAIDDDDSDLWRRKQGKGCYGAMPITRFKEWITPTFPLLTYPKHLTIEIYPK